MAETYRNAKARNVGTTPVALVTGVTSGVTMVRSVMLTPTGAVALVVDLEWTDASDSNNATVLMDAVTLAPGIPFPFPLDGPLILEDGDQLRVTASAAGLDATAAIVELT